MQRSETVESGQREVTRFSSAPSPRPERDTSEKRAESTTPQKRVIVLAGGEGERMRETVTSWLGHHRPKQYCTFVGKRSMLQHTVDRARALVPDHCITTVIGRNHHRFLQTEGNLHIPGRILEQPSQKDTGPGLFLPLTYVMTEDPDATVIVFPSDQCVVPEKAFLERVDRAATLTHCFENCLILLAAVPDQCETDYGWIRTSSNSLSLPGFTNVKRVDSFIEKPGSEMAELCFLSGCYWNTMVMAAMAKTLWQMGWDKLPGVMTGFETLRRVLLAIKVGRANPGMEEIAVQYLYRNLSPANFSRCIMEKVTKQLLVLPLSKVKWSDWGRPSRIVDSLYQMGKMPRFLLESSSRRGGRTDYGGEVLNSLGIRRAQTSAEGIPNALDC
ncbi:MAG: sugar phosphate nucleotidyltransferase [bacterium]